jgi:hypothetical protein
VKELVVWRVPQPVQPSGHSYKYRAVCAVDGVRVIGFDNERDKGDHCHLHRRRGCGNQNAMRTRRRLTITMTADWRAALRQAGEVGQADR